MSQEQKHWNSTALVLFGMWLWEQGEYGHALLCMHAPQWGLKIGTQLKVSWDDVLSYDDKVCYLELHIADKDIPSRYINPIVKESIETAFRTLEIGAWEDSLYMNYTTGKPLTSSTLNRELQRFSEKFLREVQDKTGMVLNLKPLKTNAFEIAWALDMVEKYHYSKQVFIELSKFMGHRTVKDTISLLEVEPNDTIVFEFENIRGINSMVGANIFSDPSSLGAFIFTHIKRGNKE